MDNSVEALLQESRLLFEQGNPQEARKFLGEKLHANLKYGDFKFAVACLDFWKGDFVQMDYMASDFEKGECLLTKWKRFIGPEFLQKDDWKDYKDTPYVTSAKKFAFSVALKQFLKLQDEKNPRQKAEILRRIGLCHKRLGNYEQSLDVLREANALTQGSSADMIAELADCYALTGDDRTAKLLFREAFFIDAQKIDLSWLDSELIQRLVALVKDEVGEEGPLLLEWIPVYGVLYGVFNVKRDLRATEAGQLKQAVYTKENESKNPTNKDRRTLVPRLIYMYFWLMDHYSGVPGGEEKINQIMLKIKLLEPKIYAMCTR